MFFIIALFVLLAAGIYLGEISWRVALVYLLIAAIIVCSVIVNDWNPMFILGGLGFLDAVLAIHVFKANINFRRY